MELISTLLIAVSLAMDAFSVSLTKGFTFKDIRINEVLWYGIFFGGFQILMPVLGWFLGIQLESFISTFAPWVAFILLFLIGLNMIRESLSDNEDFVDDDNGFSFIELTFLAIATSIDAFAVGITYAVLEVNILIPVIIIGIVAFLFTVFGIYLGKKIGDYFGDKFEILGGVVLIILGFKILFEGLGFI